MIKKVYIFGFFQVVVTFIIGWYMDCVSSNRLLLTEDILTESFRNKLLSHPIIILVTLGLINLILFVLSHKNKESSEQTKIYNNICNSVFDEFIKKNDALDNSLFRVSLFKVKKGLIFKRKKFFLPIFTNYLINVGRAQTKQELDLCKIKFLPKEGSVGSCFSIAKLVFTNTDKFNEQDKNKYYEEQLSKTALPIFKAKQLNCKSSSFLSCPIKFFNSNKLFGVLVVDCENPNVLDNVPEFRIIENVLLKYSVFFNEN